LAERKSILVRLQPELYQALQRWAQDELRSVNGQLEYVLRDALTRAGRMRRPQHDSDTPPSPDDS
jgi:hypothetical protein